MKLRKFTYSAILSLGLALAACQQTHQLPSGSSVAITPSSRNIEIQEIKSEAGNCIYYEEFYQDSPLQIVVTDGDGAPVGEADVSVYVDYAENTFSGLDVLALYHDANSNGVIDGPEELVSGSADGIYRGKTSKYSGVLFLLLRINLSCAYRGQVFAFSGPVSGSMDIDITHSSVR